MRRRSPCGLTTKPTSLERVCRARSRWAQDFNRADSQTAAFAGAVDLSTLPSASGTPPPAQLIQPATRASWCGLRDAPGCQPSAFGFVGTGSREPTAESRAAPIEAPRSAVLAPQERRHVER